MIEVCRAHLGPVCMLECSQAKLSPIDSNTSEQPIGTADRLISCSKDLKVKIWSLLFDESDLYMFSLICLKVVCINKPYTEYIRNILI